MMNVYNTYFSSKNLNIINKINFFKFEMTNKIFFNI